MELAYLRRITEGNYLFVANFSLPSEALANIQTITIHEISISRSFSLFSIILRFVFFGCSVAVLVLYVTRIRMVSWRLLVIEQKLVLILSCLCTLFNDPFYPITVLQPNNTSNFFSVLFVINMAIALLYFWLCVLEVVVW